MEKIKIIYILGDGRSGSTLLESVLNNSEEVVSVGECYRFWERFYKNETYCGCGKSICECSLWNEMNTYLSQNIQEYYPPGIRNMIQFWLLFKNNRKIIKQNPEVQPLMTIVRAFYKGIAQASGKSIILDSSKSPSWARIISLVDEFDLRLVHVERSLPSVMDSWKKVILLPEFKSRQVYMPVKSDLSALRTWLKVKILSCRLKDIAEYYFVRYEDFCNSPNEKINSLIRFLGIKLDYAGPFFYMKNHAIAGNPLRSAVMGTTIEIKNFMNGNGSNLRAMLFRAIHKIADYIW